MPHWRKCFNNDYIGSWDIPEGGVVITIDDVKVGELEGQKGEKSKAPLVHFSTEKGRSPKPFVCNRTNAKTISMMYGNRTEDWHGKEIELYATTCEAFGDTVECIRVKPGVPK